MTKTRVALVTGASGQDGFFLTRRLLEDGWIVHAVTRRPNIVAALARSPSEGERLAVHAVDILDAEAVARLIREAAPSEIYNLAGQSSVSRSFLEPEETWQTNAHAVMLLLDAVRRHAPEARVYQSSSGEMFGWLPGVSTMHDEDSRFLPQSPYAAAKAAAHLLCGTYRRAFGLRIACGILFNHESHRRPASFLTRKVVDHVRRLQASSRESLPARPLAMGNLAAERDWGYAPDYVEGMMLVLRQVDVRATRRVVREPDVAGNYRDYVLASGRQHAVWQLVDMAFASAGIQLDWDRSSSDVRGWTACFRTDGRKAVIVDPALLRPSDPPSIAADPSRARAELGWRPRIGLDVILQDMLAHPQGA